MIQRLTKLRPKKILLEKINYSNRVFIKNVKICRLKKNLVIAGIGAFICSAIGGVVIAFVVAFFSCLIEEVYDMGIYDKKFSLNFEALYILFSKTISLNSNKELKHPKDIMLPNAPLVENFTIENSEEFSNAYQHAS